MGGVAGSVESGFTQSAMVVDYVRVYQEEVASIEASLNTTTSIYPNPTKDKIYVTSDVAPSSLAVYDVFGKLILRKVHHTDSINLGNLNHGVYYIEMHFDQDKVVKKVIVN